MPIITVSMYTGRTQRDKDKFVEAITEDLVNILKVEKKDVIIVFQEASHGNWYAILVMGEDRESKRCSFF